MPKVKLPTTQLIFVEHMSSGLGVWSKWTYSSDGKPQDPINVVFKNIALVDITALLCSEAGIRTCGMVENRMIDDSLWEVT